MSQIAKKKFPIVMLLGGLSVNLNHLKMQCKLKPPKNAAIDAMKKWVKKHYMWIHLYGQNV